VLCQLSYTHHRAGRTSRLQARPGAPPVPILLGAPEGIRTPDPRLRRPLLCPPELLARPDETARNRRSFGSHSPRGCCHVHRCHMLAAIAWTGKPPSAEAWIDRPAPTISDGCCSGKSLLLAPHARAFAGTIGALGSRLELVDHPSHEFLALLQTGAELSLLGSFDLHPQVRKIVFQNVAKFDGVFRSKLKCGHDLTSDLP
jgi:hypothetical protein